MAKNEAFPQNNNENSNRGVILTKQELFSGPLPHPDILARFNVVVPGSAEIIIQMAENQSAHRIEIEKKVINSDIGNSKRGQIFGFVVAILGLLSSFVLVLKGYQVVGTILGGATLVSLVGVFVYGSESRKNERKEKNENMEKILQKVENKEIKN